MSKYLFMFLFEVAPSCPQSYKFCASLETPSEISTGGA